MFAFLRQIHVSLGFVNYLCTHELCCRYLFLQFKDCRGFRQINSSQTLLKLQYLEFDLNL